MSAQRLRLPFLDGVRGLAALYVVFYHAYCTSDCSTLGWRHTLPPLLEKLLRWLLHGNLAVDVFIVLSGFCLMLPVIAHPEHRLEGGFGRYLSRRARRILPPYFSAVLLSLGLIALVPALAAKADVYWDSTLPAFRTDVLLSHLFVIHNLDPDWSSKINYPLWSVATEWQIYFFLPLLILPIWRRLGIVAAVVSASIVSLLPHFLFHGKYDVAYPHFLGLFAIGAAGAVIGVKHDPRKTPWGVIALAAWVPLVLSMQFRHEVFVLHRIVMDFVVGLATMALLIYGAHCTRREEKADSLVLRVLEAPATMWLGAISYSLYLIHAPVLASLHAVTRSFHLASLPTLLVLVAVGVPLALLAGFGFHLVCERPFLTSRPARSASGAVPALP
jgi:peptidoglycan/LPS O-acetylase OafA/YrhL